MACVTEIELLNPVTESKLKFTIHESCGIIQLWAALGFLLIQKLLNITDSYEL